MHVFRMRLILNLLIPLSAEYRRTRLVRLRESVECVLAVVPSLQAVHLAQSVTHPLFYDFPIIFFIVPCVMFVLCIPLNALCNQTHACRMGPPVNFNTLLFVHTHPLGCLKFKKKILF